MAPCSSDYDKVAGVMELLESLNPKSLNLALLLLIDFLLKNGTKCPFPGCDFVGKKKDNTRSHMRTHLRAYNLWCECEKFYATSQQRTRCVASHKIPKNPAGPITFDHYLLQQFNDAQNAITFVDYNDFALLLKTKIVDFFSLQKTNTNSIFILHDEHFLRELEKQRECIKLHPQTDLSPSKKSQKKMRKQSKSTPETASEKSFAGNGELVYEPPFFSEGEDHFLAEPNGRSCGEIPCEEESSHLENSQADDISFDDGPMPIPRW